MNKIATLRAGARPLGIVPTTFEDVQRLASMAVKSGLFKGDRKDDEAQKLAKSSMIIMQGLDVGVPPMQALQSMTIINGRVLMYGDLLTGVLWAHGFKIDQSVSGEGDKRTATCTITRPDGTKITRTFSVADAKKARLWDDRPTVKKQWDGKWEEKPNDSPWFRFQDRMLGWRAFGFAQKDGASDVTRGLFLREEYEHNEPIDITPNTPETIEPPSPDLPSIPASVTQEVEPLPDPDGYCEHLKDQLRECPPEERDDVMSSNQDMIERLPAHLRKQIDDLTAELSA